MLTPQMQLMLKAEILNDASARGYAGKSPQEVADLVNSPYQEVITLKQDRICRISAIFDMVASAPNAISAADVTSALGS